MIKKSIPNSVCVGALMMGSLVVAHCGGDDSARPTAGGGSSNTGQGGSSSPGTGGATFGTGGTVSTGVGGSNGVGGVSTGAGGTTGAGGITGAGGSPNNTFCPAVEPTPGDACSPPPADAGLGANACTYPGANGGAGMTCSCRAGNMRNDAGMRLDAWACNPVFMRPDAGPPPPVVDAGLMNMCPANNVPNNGNCTQFVTGLVCPGAAGRTCTCRAAGMGGGGAKTWNCPVVIPDAGRGGG